MKDGDFKVPLGAVDKVVKNLKKEQEAQIKILTGRMNSIVNLVWGIAHQRRPYISAAQARFEGRPVHRAKTLERKTAGGKIHRVSDPNAEAGVPVAFIDGGALQDSVKKSVTVKGDKVLGRVWTDSLYAKYLEYGTSKMQARPFMRPAYDFAERYAKEVLTKKK